MRSHTAQNAWRAGPILTAATHAISSGPNIPTYRHAFNGRPPWRGGIGAGGSASRERPGGRGAPNEPR